MVDTACPSHVCFFNSGSIEYNNGLTLEKLAFDICVLIFCVIFVSGMELGWFCRFDLRTSLCMRGFDLRKIWLEKEYVWEDLTWKIFDLRKSMYEGIWLEKELTWESLCMRGSDLRKFMYERIWLEKEFMYERRFDLRKFMCERSFDLRKFMCERSFEMRV